MSARRVERGRLRSSKNKEIGKSCILGVGGQETCLKPQFALHGTEHGADIKLENFILNFKFNTIYNCNRNFRI